MSSPSADHVKSPPIHLPSHLPPSPPLSPKPTSSPQLPPNVTRILRLLRARCYGRVVNRADWTQSPLSGEEYECLEHAIAEVPGRFARWYQDQVRSDFDPSASRRRLATADREGAIAQEEGAKEAGVYTLRMPSRRHEHFIANVVRELQHRIEQKPGLDGVQYSGSPTLSLSPPRLENSSQESGSVEDVVVKRSPDATFFPPDRNGEQDLPSVVIEVGYSQQLKDLPKLAESYIVDSRHAIRCVVGIDIPYPKKGKKGVKHDQSDIGDRAATVSVWRAATMVEHGENVGICRCDIDAIPFQTSSDGQICDGSLDLYISDFIPSASSTLVDAAADKISIPFPTLSSFVLPIALNPANPTLSIAASTESEPTRFRKRKRSPCEQMEEEREADFLRREREDSEKEQAVDSAYRAGSGSRGRKTRRRAAGGEDEQVVTVVERRRRSARLSAAGRRGSISA